MKKASEIFFILFALAIAFAIFKMVTRRVETPKPVMSQPASSELMPGFERVLEVDDVTYLVLRGTVIARLSDKDWDTLTNAFPNLIVRSPMIFDKAKE